MPDNGSQRWRTAFELDQEKKMLPCPLCGHLILTDRCHRRCPRCDRRVTRLSENSIPHKTVKLVRDED